MEEDEEYEMLEVQEEEDNTGQAHNSGESDGESPNKSNSSTGSPEKAEKPLTKTLARSQTTPTSTTHQQQSELQQTPSTKLLNSMAGTTPKSNSMPTPQTPSATAAALQKKGITMKKTPANQQGRSLINQNLKNQQGKFSGKNEYF